VLAIQLPASRRETIQGQQIGAIGDGIPAVIFAWFGRMAPNRIEFWFIMQLAMACGFFTSYPMNWWLVTPGSKTAM